MRGIGERHRPPDIETPIIIDGNPLTAFPVRAI